MKLKKKQRRGIHWFNIFFRKKTNTRFVLHSLIQRIFFNAYTKFVHMQIYWALFNNLKFTNILVIYANSLELERLLETYVRHIHRTQCSIKIDKYCIKEEQHQPKLQIIGKKCKKIALFSDFKVLCARARFADPQKKYIFQDHKWHIGWQRRLFLSNWFFFTWLNMLNTPRRCFSTYRNQQWIPK